MFDAGPLRRADGGIDFEAIAKAHQALLHRIPRYRQVLRFTPVTGHPVLRGHRATEADLVYEAFWIDLGAGD